MTVLLDTDVLVDCLRGWPAAEQWLRENSHQPFLVPGLVAMELVCGCPNQDELNRMRRFLHRFAIIWPTHLHSFNQRHFACVSDLDVQPPYTR